MLREPLADLISIRNALYTFGLHGERGGRGCELGSAADVARLIEPDQERGSEDIAGTGGVDLVGGKGVDLTPAAAVMHSGAATLSRDNNDRHLFDPAVELCLSDEVLIGDEERVRALPERRAVPWRRSDGAVLVESTEPSLGANAYQRICEQSLEIVRNFAAHGT